MSAPGEIAALTGLVEPHVGLVTNVSPAHMQFFSSIDDIAAAKGELFAALGNEATSVVNLDDEHVRVQATRHAGPRVTYGRRSTADLVLMSVDDRFVPGARLTVRHGTERHELDLGLGGAHNARNALAALATVLACGLPLEPAMAAVAAVRAGEGRGRVHELAAGVIVVDDCYNSSPAALAAVLETLSGTEIQGRKILVMGDMLELGPRETAFHREAGRRAARAGVQILVGVGSRVRVALGGGSQGRGSGDPAREEREERGGDLARTGAPRRSARGQGLPWRRTRACGAGLAAADGGDALMFYHLLYPLHEELGVFNVFRYITFRTAMATLTALLVSLLLGPSLIRQLRLFPDRTGNPRGGPGLAPAEAGHADDGWRVVDRGHRAAHAAVGRSHQPLRLDRGRRHADLRRHRFCRRLSQGRQAAQPGPDGTSQVLVADPRRGGAGRGAGRVGSSGSVQHRVGVPLLQGPASGSGLGSTSRWWCWW